MTAITVAEDENRLETMRLIELAVILSSSPRLSILREYAVRTSREISCAGTLALSSREVQDRDEGRTSDLARQSRTLRELDALDSLMTTLRVNSRGNELENVKMAKLINPFIESQITLLTRELVDPDSTMYLRPSK